ncbi:MAG: hypothetical protein Q7R84_01945 [bacterium]|nr:hypothetical protein [bacterium]
MKEDIKQLRGEIDRLDSTLKQKQKQLKQIENSCCHDWAGPKYTPKYYKAYRISGDKPGTMGSDWQGPMDVPAETIEKWTRECRICGTTQVTTDTEPTGRKPVFC